MSRIIMQSSMRTLRGPYELSSLLGRLPHLFSSLSPLSINLHQPLSLSPVVLRVNFLPRPPLVRRPSSSSLILHHPRRRRRRRRRHQTSTASTEPPLPPHVHLSLHPSLFSFVSLCLCLFAAFLSLFVPSFLCLFFHSFAIGLNSTSTGASDSRVRKLMELSPQARFQFAIASMIS